MGWLYGISFLTGAAVFARRKIWRAAGLYAVVSGVSFSILVLGGKITLLNDMLSVSLILGSGVFLWSEHGASYAAKLHIKGERKVFAAILIVLGVIGLVGQVMTAVD